MKLIFLYKLAEFALAQDYGHHDEEFNLFIFSIVLVAFAAMAVSAVIVIMLAVLALVVLFGFIAMGAISGSVVIGLHKRSFTAGFITFAILFSGMSGAVIGGSVMWGFNELTGLWPGNMAVYIGLAGGLLGGVAIGFVLAFLIQKVTAWFKLKMSKNQNISRHEVRTCNNHVSL